MAVSSHWSFDLGEFVALYLSAVALLAGFYLLAGDRLQAMMNLDAGFRPARFFVEVGLVLTLVLAAGLALSHRVGIQPLALATLGRETSYGRAVVMILGRGLLGGLALAITFELLTRIFFHQRLAEWNAPCRFANWRTYVSAAIGAAVGEEAVYRLLLFPLAAWLLGLFWKTPEGLPAAGAMWSSLVGVTLLFAATHLLALQDLGGYTIGNIARGMLVFAPPGLMLGLIFWKYGLEAAVIAHATGLIASWAFLSALAELK